MGHKKLNIDTLNIDTICSNITSEMKWSESSSRCAVRQAINGIKENPDKDIRTAAYLGLSKYYCAWSDWMNQKLADLFIESTL